MSVAWSGIIRWTCRRSLLVQKSCHRRKTSFAFQNIEVVDLISSSSASTSTQEDYLANAVRPYFEKQTPVVLRGAVAGASANQLWYSLEYWKETIGQTNNEVGAVEIGGSYGNADTERAEIPLQGYIQYLELFEERHGRIGPEDPNEIPRSIPKEELVYLAQNDLFPSLYKDIIIPKFCQEEASQVGLGRLYSVMLWLGPRGCVSPLHFDPLDNCLMQHVGRKRVWLYPPVQGGWHYAGHDGQQANTSPVNPEDEKEIGEKYPLFASQEAPPAIQCVLTPGDLLYIPAKWWHFVRSLDTRSQRFIQLNTVINPRNLTYSQDIRRAIIPTFSKRKSTMKLHSLYPIFFSLMGTSVAAFSLVTTQSTRCAPSSLHAVKDIESDSANSRRSILHRIALAPLAVGLSMIPIEPARASGGATAGGVYLLSAKQRYNERVRVAVKGLLLVGDELAAGNSKDAKEYFSAEDGGSWKDLTAAGYLLSNAFRRSSSTAPDSLPAVKRYKALAAEVTNLQKVLKKKGAGAASEAFPGVEAALETWLAEIELPGAREL